MGMQVTQGAVQTHSWHAPQAGGCCVHMRLCCLVSSAGHRYPTGRTPFTACSLLPTQAASQKVVRGSFLGWHPPRVLRCSVEALELLLQAVVQLQDGRHVAAPASAATLSAHTVCCQWLLRTSLLLQILRQLPLTEAAMVRPRKAKPGPWGVPVAVVGGRPHGDQLVVEHGLVALHDQLVRPGHQLDLRTLGLVSPMRLHLRGSARQDCDDAEELFQLLSLRMQSLPPAQCCA